MAPPTAAPQGTPQLKRPLDTPEEKLPEQKKPKKNIKGPRAVGLLQLTSAGEIGMMQLNLLGHGPRRA